MKIRRVQAFPLVRPFAGVHKSSTGLPPAQYSTLIRIETDAGIEGWGECLARYAPSIWASLAEDVFQPLLVDCDPFDSEYLWDRMYRGLASFSGHSRGIVPEVIAGIDIALWDIKGREVGLPIHKLLGSFGRQSLACYGSSIGRNNIEKRLADTEEALRRGFTSLKVKIGAGVAEDIAAIDAIRQTTGPDFPLSVDANCAYSFADAARLAEALYEREIVWLEEPLRTEDREGYRKLRNATKIALAAGEGEFTRWGVKELLETGAIDIIQPNATRAGGITETKKIIDLASAYHCAYAPHTGASGALCATAALHLAAAAPNFISYEYSLHDNPLRDELIRDPIAIDANLKDGKIPVPAKPGLGVEIDQKVLERYAAH
jgi:D-galactarolactone cycloisomerase